VAGLPVLSLVLLVAAQRLARAGQGLANFEVWRKKKKKRKKRAIEAGSPAAVVTQSWRTCNACLRCKAVPSRTS
jgi:hypothetical protein